MLKILFSPSENKNFGGQKCKNNLFGSNSARDDILNEYDNIIRGGNEEQIKDLFGFKKFSDSSPYIDDFLNSLHCISITAPHRVPLTSLPSTPTKTERPPTQRRRPIVSIWK